MLNQKFAHLFNLDVIFIIKLKGNLARLGKWSDFDLNFSLKLYFYTISPFLKGLDFFKIFVSFAFQK